jgi:hypothetical protein
MCGGAVVGTMLLRQHGDVALGMSPPIDNDESARRRSIARCGEVGDLLVEHFANFPSECFRAERFV